MRPGARGHADLTPGAVLLGSAGAAFECAHDHGAGDRCLAVQFSPEAFAELHEALHAAGAAPALAGRRDAAGLPRVALPVHRATTGLFALAEVLAGRSSMDGEAGFTLATRLAEGVMRLVRETPGVETDVRPVRAPIARRIAEVARAIEADPAAAHTLATLAAGCGVGRFQFLRQFRDTTGLTPYAFVRRARLRDAARLLLTTDLAVGRVALEAGFGDLSTFNAAFHAQFGTPPRALRRGGLTAAARAHGTRALDSLPRADRRALP